MSKQEQITIVMYLMGKLNLEESWFYSAHSFLFDSTPQKVILRGDGELLINWLESRLGLTPSSGF